MSFRPFGLKNVLACVLSVLLASGAVGSGFVYTPAIAELDQTDTNSEGDYYFELPVEDTGEDSSETDTESPDEQPDDQQQEDSGEDLGDPDDVTIPLEAYDVTKYAEKLKEINERQKALEDEMSQADSAIINEEINQKKLEAKIKVINEKQAALNEYITAMEMEMAANKRELKAIEEEITDGVEGLKMRIRALYLAGSDSYTTVILESQSFYDVLMRLELVKRVAKHDDELLDNLYVLKNQHESKQAELDRQQADYDARLKELEESKAELDKLYQTSESTKKELEVKQKLLEMSDQALDLEKALYADDLSGILRSPIGKTSRDDEVRATMALADLKLEELHDELRKRIKNGGELGEYEPAYNFAWPLPGCYSITSGVGARWGSYHQGIDISGSKGTPIRASESGVVIRASQTCIHDYGKYSSCGCGGGYGNYVIIDHGNDFITLYGHMTQLNCRVGDQVKQGDCIGYVGSTGFSTGDHLHFEIRYQGYIVNPAYYVDVSILPSKDQTADRNPDVEDMVYPDPSEFTTDDSSDDENEDGDEEEQDE